MRLKIAPNVYSFLIVDRQYYRSSESDDQKEPSFIYPNNGSLVNESKSAEVLADGHNLLCF